MKEELKNKLTEEEAREVLKIADNRPKNGCVCDAIFCNTECRIKNLKQAGIIKQSAKEEAKEYLNNIKETL